MALVGPQVPSEHPMVLQGLFQDGWGQRLKNSFPSTTLFLRAKEYCLVEGAVL